METEMDAENGNSHGIKLAHAHKNSHGVVTVVRKPGSNPRANACETPFCYTRRHDKCCHSKNENQL